MAVERCPTCAKPLGDTLTDRILAFLVEYEAATGMPASFAFLRNHFNKTDQAMAVALKRLAQRGAIEKVTRSELTGWVLTPHQLDEQGVPPSQEAALAQEVATQVQQGPNVLGEFRRAIEIVRGQWAAGANPKLWDILNAISERTGLARELVDDMFWKSFYPATQHLWFVDEATSVIRPLGDGYWTEARSEAQQRGVVTDG